MFRICRRIWLSQPDLLCYLHLCWPTLLEYFTSSQEQTFKPPLCSSLAADEASELLGWALPSHRLLYPVQAHGGLCVHRLQRFRRRAALRGVRALQQAGSLSHHHVQQRSAPVWQTASPSFCCSQSLCRCRLETAALLEMGLNTKYLIWNSEWTWKIFGEILELCLQWLTEMNSTIFLVCAVEMRLFLIQAGKMQKSQLLK